MARPPLQACPPTVAVFRVQLRCMAEVTVTRELRAVSKSKAREQALAAVESEPVDLAQAKKTWKVVALEPAGN
jgi:hypothetical protein